jgi:hypothetical protein
MEARLTKLLDGTVGTPGKLKCHVDTAPLVLDPAVSLEGDAGAGSLGDDGYELGVGWVGTLEGGAGPFLSCAAQQAVFLLTPLSSRSPGRM